MSEKKANIEFTEEEATQLIKVMDLAVRQVGVSDGGEVANNALYFIKKLNEAFAGVQEHESVEKEPSANGVAAN